MDDAEAVLTEHVRRALIHDLGATRLDVWLGKDGLQTRGVAEVAALIVASLAPLLEDDHTRALVHDLRKAHRLTPTLDPRDPHDW